MRERFAALYELKKRGFAVAYLATSFGEISRVWL